MSAPRAPARAPTRSTTRGQSRGPGRKSPRTAKGADRLRPGAFHATIVDHAETLLDEILRFDAPADAIASRYFRAHPALGHRDRGLIAESVFAVLRHKLEFAQLAQSGSGSLTRRLVLLGLAGAAGVEPIAATLDATERTWLRRIATIDRTTLSFATRCNFPEWLLAALRKRFADDEIEVIASALNRPAPLDLRANTFTTTRDDALAALREWEIEAEPTRLAPSGIRLKGKPALADFTLFKSGGVEVQDEGSQLLAYLVAPRRGEMVIDFCAGAGGKTLALGALMRSTGRLYAIDVSQKRLARLKPRLARSGLSNVHPVAIDSERDPKLKRLAGKADRVLVDAPCSGLGTLRRNPDLKWRQSPQTIAELAVKQSAILAAAARLVKPGGRLVYATCSLLDDENGAVVRAFLVDHTEFEVEDANEILRAQGIAIESERGVADRRALELWPHRTDTDGFFAMVMRRRA